MSYAAHFDRRRVARVGGILGKVYGVLVTVASGVGVAGISVPGPTR